MREKDQETNQDASPVPPPPPVTPDTPVEQPVTTQFASEFDTPAPASSPPPAPASSPPPVPAPAPAEPDSADYDTSDPDDYDKDPSILIDHDRVILENGAELPTEFCVKSGKPAFCVVNKALRDPRDPRTWFGGRPRIDVGLSKKHRENRLVSLALTWSVFGMGVLILIGGLVLIDPGKLAFGLFLVFISGIFRAYSPVWAARVDEDCIEIRGTGQLFRDRLKGIPGAELDYEAKAEED